MTQYDRECDQIEQALENGHISQSEYNQQMRDLDHDYREAALESARDAYERELERWYP